MNDKTLKQKLIAMENELTNLKIAHERGFGTVQFFYYEQELPQAGVYRITLTPATETLPFYAQAEGVWQLDSSLDWTETAATMTIYSYGALGIVSSTKLASINAELQS